MKYNTNNPNPKSRQSSGNIAIPTATRNLFNGYRLRLLLTDDPVALDQFVANLGDPKSDLYLVHTRRGQWAAIGDPSIEKPLGFACRACRRSVMHYSGEWQERVRCGC